MRTIGLLTVARSDYNICLPVAQEMHKHADLSAHWIVAGAHLSPEFGLTVRAIEADGIEIGERIEMLLSSDSPEGIAKSMGLGTLAFATSYARRRPDLLLVFGDRFEVHAAVVAALPFKIPVAHVHGGEITQGAFDDALRHSITKLSHLHFVATPDYARRLIQMGEEPHRIIVCGAPALDHLRSLTRLDLPALEAQYGFQRTRPPLLVTFHPVTLEYEQSQWQVSELLAALEAFKNPVIFTAPNEDTNGRSVLLQIREFVQGHPGARLVENLGARAYFSLMAAAAAMVGNSSSGIIEAPSFELPVVNIGSRQAGRVRAANVIDVGYERAQVLAGIRKALDPAFRSSLRGLVNPYGDGSASRTIVARLRTIPLEGLVLKRFCDHPAPCT